MHVLDSDIVRAPRDASGSRTGFREWRRDRRLRAGAGALDADAVGSPLHGRHGVVPGGRAVRSAAPHARRHSPDVVIEIPRSACNTLDFHRAEAMIEIGRHLAEEALGCPAGECHCRDRLSGVPLTRARARPRGAAQTLALALLLGAAVALTIGVYARVHEPALRPLFLVGFSGMLQLKTWLASVALLLVVVQVLSALAMWGRLPGVAGHARPGLPGLHRWTGTVAFLLTLPVAFHCVWSLGFEDYVHAGAGALRRRLRALRRVRRQDARPAPARPAGLAAAGARWAVFAAVIVVWSSSALWFFSRSGVALLSSGPTMSDLALSRRGVLRGSARRGRRLRRPATWRCGRAASPGGDAGTDRGQRIRRRRPAGPNDC